MYVFGNELRNSSGEAVRIFGSHWEAVTALFRITDPDFMPLDEKLFKSS